MSASVSGTGPHLVPINIPTRDLDTVMEVVRRLEAELIHHRAELRGLHEEIAKVRNSVQVQSHMATHQEAERMLRDQVKQMKAQLEEAQAESKRKALDFEILSARMEFLREKEKVFNAESQRAQAWTAQASAQASAQVSHLRGELARYQAALQKLQAQNHRSDETTTAAQARLEQMEIQMKKERHDKQIALNCLQSAEIKLEEMARELEQIKQRIHKDSESDQRIALSLL